MGTKLELFHLNDQQAASNSVLQNMVNTSAILQALRNQELGEDISLFIAAGDTYQPGFLQDASRSLYGARSVGEMQVQNELGVDAIAVGNHEFDSPVGSEGFAELISGVDSDGESIATIFGVDYSGTQFPYLSTNLNFSEDIYLNPLVVEGGQIAQPRTISSSVVIEKNGVKVGVVGVTTPGLQSITGGYGGVTASPFAEAQLLTDEQLVATAAIVQQEVDALLEANPDVKEVILTSHLQIFNYETRLAELLRDVDIIIAGGSEIVTADSNDILREGDVQSDVYPRFINNAGGSQTAVVTEVGDYNYLGRLVIEFDDDGNILPASYDAEVSGTYATDAAGVSRLDAEDLSDPQIVEITNGLTQEIASVQYSVYGYSDVFLNRQPGLDNLTRADVDGIRTQETNLGNLTADANLVYAQSYDPTVQVSIKNGGGIRASIGDFATRSPNNAVADESLGLSKGSGAISQGDIQATLTFNNGLRLINLTKQQLVAALEHGVEALPLVDGRYPQISGVQFHYDSNADAGSRVQHVDIVDHDGAVVQNILTDGELVGDADELIRIVTLDFLTMPRFDESGAYIGGGDSYPWPNINFVDGVYYSGDGESIDQAEYQRLDVVDLEDVMNEPGDATFAAAGSEQDALAEYLLDRHATPETAYRQRDVGRAFDTRSMDLAFQPAPIVSEVEIIGDPKGGQVLKGGKTNDVITAFQGRDLLKGRKGHDILSGGNGRDNVRGGKGNDVLDGGTKADVLTGGAGHDRFVLSKGSDTITDFNLAEDHIAIPAQADVRVRDLGDDVKIAGDGFKTTILNVSHSEFVAEMPMAHL